MAAVLSASPNLPSMLDQLQQLSPAEQMAFCQEQVRQLDSATSGESSESRRLFDLLSVHMRAMRQYQPRAYHGSEVVFFRATEHDVLYPPNPERGWVDFAAEGIAIYDVPGNHISMNQAPHVQAMAKKLRRYLDQVAG